MVASGGLSPAGSPAARRRRLRDTSRRTIAGAWSSSPRRSLAARASESNAGGARTCGQRRGSGWRRPRQSLGSRRHTPRPRSPELEELDLLILRQRRRKLRVRHLEATATDQHELLLARRRGETLAREAAADNGHLCYELRGANADEELGRDYHRLAAGNAAGSVRAVGTLGVTIFVPKGYTLFRRGYRLLQGTISNHALRLYVQIVERA